jgi:hypothetical protein
MGPSTAALRPFSQALPASLQWELLADERVELRRAGYRLLHGHAPQVRLRAARLLAADTDPRVSFSALKGRACRSWSSLAAMLTPRAAG